MDTVKTGRMIAQARKERGLTQRELAERLHVTDRAVSKWERGLSFPDVSALEPLSAALGLPLSRLITGEDADAADEQTLRQSVQTFRRELKTKIRRTAWLTAALIAGIAALTAGLCYLWRYVPAQRTAIRQMPLTAGEAQIAAAGGTQAVKFRLRAGPEVKACRLTEETWTPEGLASEQALWSSDDWRPDPSAAADNWQRTRRAELTVGFSWSDHSYTWHCMIETGVWQRYTVAYPEEISALWCPTYRELTGAKLHRGGAVPLMAVYIADHFPARLVLDGLQPGETVPVPEGAVVKILWLTAE